MIRRFFTNLEVNLAAGFVLFFFSERLFWTVYKPGDRFGELAITWLAYSVLACVFLNIQKRFGASDLPRLALCGAAYGWLAEGALVGTLYGTESSAPFPLSIVQTALSWHMLISVLAGWYLLVGAVRRGALAGTVVISAGIGLFWAAWAPFQWRESPPVTVPVGSFAAHAAVTGIGLAVACGILSGEQWSRYRPGWFGLTLATLVLAVFYNEQIKATGVRALILLPLLIGGVLALLYWAKSNQDSVIEYTDAFKRWRCAAAIGVMPATATAFYALQTAIGTRGIDPSWIFHGLALVGGVTFLAACALTVRMGYRQRIAKKRAAGEGVRT